MSIVLLSLASAHSQGRASTFMCTCPSRGDALRAPAPNTGRMRTFSTRYWAWKRPWASGRGSGGSTISLGGGSCSISPYGEGPRISLALWAKAVALSRVPAAIAVSVFMSLVIAFTPEDLTFIGSMPLAAASNELATRLIEAGSQCGARGQWCVRLPGLHVRKNGFAALSGGTTKRPRYFSREVAFHLLPSPRKLDSTALRTVLMRWQSGV